MKHKIITCLALLQTTPLISEYSTRFRKSLLREKTPDATYTELDDFLYEKRQERNFQPTPTLSRKEAQQKDVQKIKEAKEQEQRSWYKKALAITIGSAAIIWGAFVYKNRQ